MQMGAFFPQKKHRLGREIPRKALFKNRYIGRTLYLCLGQTMRKKEIEYARKYYTPVDSGVPPVQDT